MAMMSIAEILVAAMFFTVLGVISYVKKNGREKERTTVLHNPAYIMYE